MRRLPFVPTLVVALAVAAMVALGFWQLRRAEWKERMLADYAAAATMPAVDLDPLLDGRPTLPPLSFRRALVTCHAQGVRPEVRAGRDGADRVGQVYLIPCRPGASGPAGRIRVNAGWSARLDNAVSPSLDGIVAGRLGAVAADGPIVLTSATAAPPLVPSAPASIESIPNNHRFYALQWFFFAGLAAVIFVLALRRRNAASLPPEP